MQDMLIYSACQNCDTFFARHFNVKSSTDAGHSYIARHIPHIDNLYLILMVFRQFPWGNTITMSAIVTDVIILTHVTKGIVVFHLRNNVINLIRIHKSTYQGTILIR